MRVWLTVASVGLALACAGPSRAAAAAPTTDTEPLEAIQIHPNFYVIAGAGANIAVQTGDNGTVLVDAGTLKAARGVSDLIKTITDQPVRYIIDSSAAADHVGGNGVLAKGGRSIFYVGAISINTFDGLAGKLGASIFAPVAVLQRISAPTGQTPPFPSDTWPTEAFAGKREYLYFNHEGIEVFHQPAHDDTDSIVFFRGSDVICAGDAIDANRFPMIDVAHGGGIQAEIDTLNRIIELAVRPIPFVFESGGTTIIPAHGRLYQQADVVNYRDMIVIIRDTVEDMKQRGMSLAQVQAAAPAKAYDTEYGARDGAWTTNDFIAAVYESLGQHNAAAGSR